MLTGRDIVCISSIDWDFIWQGHQEIMATLAAHGNRVLFVENTGVRPPRLRDLPRLTHRMRNWWRGTKGFRQERGNLFVYSPLLFPFPYSRIAGAINRTLLLRALRRWMRATGFGRPIIWTFLPTPLVRNLIRELDPELTIYYCIDDLASSSRPARRISRSEAHMFREADVVFVTSEKLRERAARFTLKVHLFPFGVDFEAFERVRKGPDQTPADLKTLMRPVVGYVGGVHQWIDQDLLAEVANRLPSVTFALVGPPQTDVTRVARCPNVHLLGGRPHTEVPNYIKGFDVGIIPYRLSEYTASVYPTKLNEYLAMGVPVVATDLLEIRRFNVEHGDVVRVAGDAETFAQAILEAVERRSAGDVQRRVETAREGSWVARIVRMSELIEGLLRVRRPVTDWEVSLHRLYRGARRRVVGVAAVILTGYVLLSYTPAVWVMAKPLHVVNPPRSVDAIVVFAGGVGESGKAGGGYQERVKHAVELHRQRYAPRVVFSSGYGFAFQETEIMRELAIAQGVPASAILLETKASSTYENVAFVSKILEARGLRTILLVSSPYHMRRALLTWRRLAPRVEVVAAPVPESQFYAHDSGATFEQLGGILYEYAAIVVYWWRGWL